LKKFENEVEYAEWIEFENKKDEKYSSWKKIDIDSENCCTYEWNESWLNRYVCKICCVVDACTSCCSCCRSSICWLIENETNARISMNTETDDWKFCEVFTFLLLNAFFWLISRFFFLMRHCFSSTKKSRFFKLDKRLFIVVNFWLI
jgi:hypothetical protein